MKHLLQPTLTAPEYLYIAALLHMDIAGRLEMREGVSLDLIDLFALRMVDVSALCEKFAAGTRVLQAAHARGEDIGVR